MNKLDLQAEIRSLQEYRKEAESLIMKMNSVTEKINESADEEISRIKKKMNYHLHFFKNVGGSS